MYPFKVNKYQRKNARIHFKTEKEALKHLRKTGQIHRLISLKNITLKSTKEDFANGVHTSEYKKLGMLDVYIGYMLIKSISIYAKYKLKKIESRFPEVLI
jgi:hypothetical protein